MALDLIPLPEAGQPADLVTVDRHWYLTGDKGRVVEENHPDGRWLWAATGTQVPRADAVRLGAIKASPEAISPQDGAEVEVVGDESGTVKEQSKPGDKQKSKPGAKSSEPPDPMVDLRAQASELNIKVDGRWSADRLQQEIDKALA